ncbi:PqiB family protein [Dyella sp. Tek66A03]|uniref:PqiB family protein n=1 Tax=Dyella sp. Tek66A03 TaxID=3458298 RepID=UPI00403E3BF6
MMMNQTPDKNGALEPRDPLITYRRWRVSLVWVVPLVAALIGVSMLIQARLSAGPKITISFLTAAGLEAGKTPVKYKDVAIGTVSAIALSDDHSHIVATVALDKSAESLARDDTRFWVVRPRFGLGGVSGIDTVISGAYIGVDTGKSRKAREHFSGLEAPPTVINGTPGRTFVLHSDDLGSLDIGSPVYYRRIQVGRVASYQLDDDGRGVSLQVFVDAPTDRFVTQDTRFWNASGVDVSLGADGLKLHTQSLTTVVAGGIAFATPYGSESTPAPEHAQFVLTKDQQTAMAAPDGPPQYIQMRFEQSLRGLTVDAPVEFFGITIGKVISVELDYDAAKQRFPVIVETVVYPQRLGHVLEKLPQLSGDKQQQAAQFLHGMVAQGLRAQAHTGNLLTGQLYIALDIVPNTPKVDFDVNARPLIMPTVGGSLDKLQEQLASIVDKVQKIPFDSIGRNLDGDLVELNKTLKQVNGDLLPESKRTMQEARRTFGTANSALSEDGPLQQSLGPVMQEMRRTMQSLRALTDLIGRHPEALIRSLQADPKTATRPAPNNSTSPQGPSR